jgi:hypothetical protein
MTERTKIQKYVIYGDPDTGTWWARVPHGSYLPFRSWAEAAKYLRLRHQLRRK